jgi:hypothetical protein
MNVLETQLEAALVEHANKTGGIMVGDVITFGGHTVLVTAYDELRAQFQLQFMDSSSRQLHQDHRNPLRPVRRIRIERMTR